MAEGRVVLKLGAEEDYFKSKEAQQIRDIRKKCEQEKKETYCNERKNHCFRCGTESLVEVEKGDITIDICVNDHCGAIHLDPGELEAILAHKAALKNIRKSVFSIFK